MTKTEYQTLRARIEDRYRQDIVALDRTWVLFRGEDNAPVADRPAPCQARPTAGGVAREPVSAEEKRARKNEYMRAYYQRRQKKVARTSAQKDDLKGLSPKDFSKFLVKGPVAQGGNGDE